MCIDFGIVSGPLLAGGLTAAGGTAAAGAGTAASGFGLANIIGMGLTGLSTLLTAVGQVQAGKQQEQAAKYNAKMSEYAAIDAERRGSIAEEKRMQQSRLVVGQQEASQGASGVVANEGSNLDVLAQSAEYGARDAATERLNAGRDAYAYRSQGKIDTYQAGMARSSILPRVGGTLLTGATKVFEQSPWWKKWS